MSSKRPAKAMRFFVEFADAERNSNGNYHAWNPLPIRCRLNLLNPVRGNTTFDGNRAALVHRTKPWLRTTGSMAFLRLPDLQEKRFQTALSFLHT